MPIRRVDYLEPLEPRQLFAADVFRSFDGTANNVLHPMWGTVNQLLLRDAPNGYADGQSAPAGADRPSAREVSNAVLQHHRAEDIFNARHMSAFSYAFGQFIDHDLSLTLDASPREPMRIAVPEGDLSFDPFFTGTQTIPFNRSQWVGGVTPGSVRENPSVVTAYLDGSAVYGSDPVRAAALRTFTGGQLKTSAGNMLPYNTAGLANDVAFPGDDPTKYYLAGDVRANENLELTSVQVLFMREHNRLAAQIQSEHPKWNDEQIFQQARRINVAEIQSITYNEYLPSLMGPSVMPKYKGYRADVNPNIANEFSTAAFRFGHSLLSNDVQFFDNNSDTTADDVKLPETTFNPALFGQVGADSVLKYLASVDAEEVDTKMVNSIRNVLFGLPGQGGIDLPAIDVQRGRDHGLADYNSTRAALGLPRITDFSQITSQVPLQQTLAFLYGSVDNIDLFVGGLAEDHLAGSSFGPTFQRIMIDQFTRTRDGDRFWYQNDLRGQDLKLVENTTLTDLIKRNTSITNLQANSFFYDVQISGRIWNDANGNGRQDRGEAPVAGQWVYMFDDEGSAIDNAQTDANGNYLFTDVQAGRYFLSTDLPAGWRATTPPPSMIWVTRGEYFRDNNFGETPIAPTSITASQPRLLSPLELDSPATVFTMENVLVSGVLGNGVTVAQQTLDLLV